jgi:putative tricarboxylic transport membrane protein
MADDRQASDDFKDYPTLKEQGSDWALTGWRGLGIAKDTPPEIQEKLVTVLKRIVGGKARVNGESFPEFMDRQGFDHTSRPTTEFADFLKRNDEMFGVILNRTEFQSVQSGPVGPNVFPAIAGGMFGLSLIIVLAGASRRPTASITGIAAANNIVDAATPHAIFLSGCAVAAVIFHMLAADTLGFVTTSAIILFLTSKLLGERLLTSAIVAIVASVGIYQLFSGLLRVPLPIGSFLLF